MDVVLWVIAGILAAIFLAAGTTKLLRSKDALADAGMGWVQDFEAPALKVIGLLEVLAAIGLVLPYFVGVGVLVPLAATGLGLLMVGAMLTHLRREEHSLVAVNGVLLLMAAAVAVGRFAGLPFEA